MPASFVGRAAEIEALANTIDLSWRAGGPAAVMVTGDAGSGKSRLLSEACARTFDRRIICLQGSAPEQHVQLSAAGGMLEVVSREGSDDLRVLLSRPETDSVVTPLRLFEATLTSLVAMGRPVIVVIDDFHWLDESTVALTHYLLRGSLAAKFPLALVVASRPAPAASAFVVALDHLLGPERFRALLLNPLEREVGLRLVKELSPSSTDLRAEMVWKRSRGSPFWIERLAAQGDAEVGDVSTQMKDSLQSISADGVQVLIYVAVADRSMTIDELSELSGWGRARLGKAIAEIARSGLLAEVMGVVRVTHQLISEAVLGFVASEQVRRAHRGIATLLEANTRGEARVGLRALEHRLAGGLPVEETALALAASPDSRELGRTGIRRLFDIAGDAAFANITLAEALAVRAVEAGDHRLAFDLWSHLAIHSENPRAAAASLAASEAALVLDLKADAWRFLGEARRLLNADDVLSIEIDAQESFLHRWLDRRWDEATKAADRALAGVARLASTTGAVGTRPRLRATLAAADAALMAGDPARMFELSEQMVGAALGVDEQAYVRGLAEGALAMRLLGHNREASERARQAWDEARRRMLPQIAIEVGPILARILLSLGKLDEAQGVVNDYMALGDRLAEYRPARAFRVVVPSVLEAAVGNWRAAAALLKTAAEEETEPHYRLQAHMEHAALLARHDPQRSAAAVETYVAASIDDARLSGCRRCMAEALARGVEGLSRVGSLKAASLTDELSESDRGDMQLRWCRMAAEAAGTSDRAMAARAWESAADEAERQGMRFEAIRNRIDQASVLTDVDRSEAAAVARKAGAAAARIGALAEERAADRILRTLGVRTWQRGGQQSQVLTDREQQIAEMVGTGSSNPEIADALFISRKTVERHVSNILAKLGARNRAELAGIIREHTAN